MKTDIYIPIGSNCSISYYLRAQNLRKDAYPFDWNITPISSALELIDNDFKDFLKFENLVFLKPEKRMLFDGEGSDVKITDDIITPVICRRYGILFPHDFSESGVSDYQNIFDKYQRRIARLRELLANTDSLTFIYNRYQLNEWQTEQYKEAQVHYTEDSTKQILNQGKFLVQKGHSLVALSKLKGTEPTLAQKSKQMVKRIVSKARRTVS